ncbi:MAG: hypothetical protein JNL67_20990 [Planctomycetaceae bacterium]|nr:hypothetical protein [Planctomycetaceae bacterium]
MVTRRKFFSVAALVIGMLFVGSQPAEAAPSAGRDVRLFARMTAGITKGVAKYEEIKNDTRRKFSIEISQAIPGTVVTVWAGQVQMGQVAIDGFGRGKLELDTRLGHQVQKMQRGTLVEVRWNGVTGMSGSLQ